MLIAVIILSWLLLMSLTLIIIFGIEDRFSADEWVSSILFIFAFPIWVITKIIFKIKSIIAEIKRRKRLKEKTDKRRSRDGSYNRSL